MVHGAPHVFVDLIPRERGGSSRNDDEKSKLKPTQVYDAVVAAKGGGPNSIVALAVIPQLPGGSRHRTAFTGTCRGSSTSTS